MAQNLKLNLQLALLNTKYILKAYSPMAKTRVVKDKFVKNLEKKAQLIGYQKLCFLIALMLAQGAPFGHIFHHWWFHPGKLVGIDTTFSTFFKNYIAVESGDIVYIWLGTSFVFAAFGSMVGKLADRINEISSMKERLLAVVAHDLRNPLGNIHCYAELIEDSLSQDSGSEDRAEIKNIAQRLRQQTDFTLILLSDLLDYSKIVATGMKLNLVDVDIGQCIQQKIEPLYFLAKAKNIEIVEEWKGIHQNVRMDLNRFEQILTNLVSNAIKFSKEGSQITLKLSNNKPGFVTLSVTDQGLGIPKSELHKLFKPFSTTSVKGTRKEMSTGLGLYIVKQLVQLHGGEIDCVSETGKGSCFSIHFPCV